MAQTPIPGPRNATWEEEEAHSSIKRKTPAGAVDLMLIPARSGDFSHPRDGICLRTFLPLHDVELDLVAFF